MLVDQQQIASRRLNVIANSNNVELVSSSSKLYDDDIIPLEVSSRHLTPTTFNSHHSNADGDELQCMIGGNNDSLSTDMTAFCDSFFTELSSSKNDEDSFLLVADAALSSLSNDLLSSNHNIVSTVESTTSKTKTKSSTTLTSKKSKSQIPAASTTVKKKKKRIVSATYKFRPYQEEKWKERFEDLLNFRKASGHCLVPHTYPENPTLARWVKRQRYQYKLFQQKEPSSMTQERIDLLHNVGFVWHSHEVVWQERLSELMEYKKQTGDCLVPSNYGPNPKLATWVKCQRRQYKLYLRGNPSSNITVERIRILEKAGFEWELRSSSYSIKNQIAAHQQKVTALKNELVLPNTTVVESSIMMNANDDADDEDPLDFLKDEFADDAHKNINDEPVDFLMDVLNDLGDLPDDDTNMVVNALAIF